MRKIRVTVFNEHNQDRYEPVSVVYPQGIHETVADAFREDQAFEVKTITQDMPEHGLSAALLADTDVLVWWSHLDNALLDDEIAGRVCRRVVEGGMGFLALHSGIYSKPWQRMLGICYNAGAWGRFRCTASGERQRVWVIAPGHPIAEGIGDCIEIAHDEMYGEPLLMPDPDKTVFISWWEGGEVARSGCVFERGRGRLFQFTPGHETFPIYEQAEVRRVLRNAARWLAPPEGLSIPVSLSSEPRERLD